MRQGNNNSTNSLYASFINPLLCACIAFNYAWQMVLCRDNTVVVFGSQNCSGNGFCVSLLIQARMQCQKQSQNDEMLGKKVIINIQ